MGTLRSGLIYIGVFILFQGIIFAMVDRGEKYDVDFYIQQHLISQEKEFKFVLNSFARQAEIVVNEVFGAEEIVSLYSEARNNPERRDELRNRLYRCLLPSYQRLFLLGFKQVQFHFSDGTSFLRLHIPEKFGDQLFPFRESLRLANTEQRYVEGFEIGQNDYAFRYVFPISKGGVHLGTVETGVPFYSVENVLQNVFNIEYYLLLRKDALAKKNKIESSEDYLSSLLLPDYFHEKDDLAFHKSDHEGHLDFSEMTSINELLKGRIEKQVGTQEKFAIPVHWSGKDYLVTFQLLNDISGQEVGYFISYGRDTVLQAIRQKVNVIHIVLGTLLCVSFYLHFMANKRKAERIRFQQQLIEAIPTPVWFKTPEGNLSGCNTAFSETIAPARDTREQQQSSDIWKEQSVIEQHMDEEVLASKQVVKKQIEYCFADGSRHTLIVHKAPLIGSDGKVLFLVGSAFDISERKEAEDLLLESHLELDQIFNTAANGMRIIDANHVVQRVNTAFCDMVSRTSAEIVGKKCYEVFPGPNCGTISCPLDRLASGAERFKTEMQKKMAADRDIECIVTAASLRDRNGNFTGFVEDFQDITLFRKMEQKLRDMAITDKLTGIYNRRGFLLFAKKQLSAVRRSDQDAFITYIDLDNLKTINDLQGHKAGDLAIRSTALLLKKMFRQPDIVARLGGDEFAVFTSCRSGTSSNEAISRRMIEAVEEVNAKGELSFTMSISFGIARYEEKESLEQLMNRADGRMYQAKREKKNKV
ncbi:MAG: diguanylate cyclase [Proteobacteria bacterium]|nr:diguanylate cyclase [Pseudomonadota bacterium]